MRDTIFGPFEPGRVLDELAVHEHSCLVHETREQQLAVVVPFIRAGLERGERCLYIVDENATATVLCRLMDAGVDVDRAIDSGALLVVGSWGTFVHQGSFGPERLIAFLTQFAEDARSAGFSALRFTGEVPSAGNQGPAVERLLEYEERLHDFFSRQRAQAICQYNRSRFPPALIREVVRAHPLVLFRDTVCRSPEEAFAA